MKVYDRYRADSTGERFRWQKRKKFAAKAYRASWWAGLALFAAIGVIYLCVPGETYPGENMFFFGMLVLGTVVMSLALKAERGVLDGYIYGLEGGDFLLLNTMYEVVRRVAPGDVRQIRILPAARPNYRVVDWDKHQKTRFSPWCEEGTRDGYAWPVNYPMVFAYTGEAPVDWNRMEDAILLRVEDMDLRKLFQQHLAVVPHGENAEPFVHLLQNSACPVMVSRRMYGLHREMLDRMFAQAGMDMSRLVIEEK